MLAPIGYDAWKRLRDLVDWVAGNWGREDEGVWEVRGGRRHFVYSKFMSWVALDRGLRLADKRSFPADRAAWLKARDAIYEEVMAKGWSESRGSFVQSYGSDALDASALLMPADLLRRPSQRLPQHAGLACGRDPVGGHPGRASRRRARLPLRPRRPPRTGSPGVEVGTFNMCSFWLVEALDLAGRDRPGAPGRCPAAVRANAWLRQSSRAVLRADRAQRRSPGQSPAGLHPSCADQSAAFNLDRALAGRAE